MELEELQKRITRLEDIEAIKQLKARYCEICDHDNYDADAMASSVSRKMEPGAGMESETPKVEKRFESSLPGSRK